MLLHFIRPKGTRKLKRMWTNCQVHSDVVFTLTHTPIHTLCFWTWCRPKVYENSQRNANTLCDSSKKRTFLPSPTLLETLYAIGLDAVQKSHENPEWNANELCGPSENRSFLALSTPLEIIHHFSLDAVQKTTRAEKYVNELSGSLRNDTLEQDQHHYSTRDTFFLDLMPSKRPWKLKRMWTNCLAHRRSVVFSIINTSWNKSYV